MNHKMIAAKKTRMAALLLACMCAAGTVSACADAGTKTSETQTTAAAASRTTESVEEEPTGNGRSEIRDALPDTLDFGGATVRVLTRGGDDDVKIEFYSEGINGEVVNDAVFMRNEAVEERLNLKMEVLLINETRHTHLAETIRKSVQADSKDFDMTANAMYNMNTLALEGLFFDLQTLDYLDFSQPWWNQAYLNLTSYEGRNYSAFGELSQTMISGAFCMFFNKAMFREFYPDDPSLYETVNAGEWTLDKMIAYCTPLYADLNGNGKADEGDRFGHYFTDTKTLGCDSFTGGCNVNLLVKNKDGSYAFNGVSDRTVKFYEKMGELLFENNNTCRLPYNNEDIMKTMKNDQTMFTTWMLTGINYLRDMKEDFGIIPMPKLDETQENYNAFCHDGSSGFGIPVTAENPDTVAAFLEAMSAETYRIVTPAYFETALKGKYSRDDETSKMLDLIVSGIYLDIAYIYGGSLGAPIDIMRGIFANSTACEKAVSTMTKKEKSILAMMDKILQQYAEIES